MSKLLTLSAAGNPPTGADGYNFKLWCDAVLIENQYRCKHGADADDGAKVADWGVISPGVIELGRSTIADVSLMTE